MVFANPKLAEEHQHTVRQVIAAFPAGSVVTLTRSGGRVVGSLVGIRGPVIEVTTRGGLRQYVPLVEVTSVNGYQLAAAGAVAGPIARA